MVSIVITTKNRKEDLISCVESISKSTYTDYEILIVDDCSNDGTQLLTSEEFNTKNLEIFHLETPHMMVRARNFGAQQAKGDYVLFIDDDNIIDDNMISKLVTFFDNNEEYGICGPQMYYADNTKYLDYQTINFFSGKTSGIISQDEKEYYESDGIPNVFMIRKKVFDKIGFFDVQLRQTFTEPDFSFLALKNGFKSAIVHGAKTIHNIEGSQNMTPRTLGGQFIQKAYCLMRNRTIVVKRYSSWYEKLVYLLVFSWLWFVIYSLIVAKFKRWDMIKFYWHGFKDGIYYFFTNKFNNNLDKLLKEQGVI